MFGLYFISYLFGVATTLVVLEMGRLYYEHKLSKNSRWD